MRLIISSRVIGIIDSFYLASMTLHESLDENTVMKKKQRLLDSLAFLTIFPKAYGYARFKREWVRFGYREFISEDFHFAYVIRTLESGEKVVMVMDAVHSLLYHE